MTTHEAIKEIDSKHKPYTYASPSMTQQVYSKFMHRYRLGSVKEGAIIRFLLRFGYEFSIRPPIKQP